MSTKPLRDNDERTPGYVSLAPRRQTPVCRYESPIHHARPTRHGYSPPITLPRAPLDNEPKSILSFLLIKKQEIDFNFILPLSVSKFFQLIEQ